MKQNKQLKVKPFIEQKITELKSEKQRNAIKYTILISILTVFNLAMVITAIYAIVKLDTSGNTNETGVILSSLAAGFVVLLFFAHNISVFYKAVMNDKSLKRALDKIQHEVMRYTQKMGDYNDEDSIKHLHRRVDRIKEEVLSKKAKDKKVIFLKSMLGGLDG